MGKRLQLMIVMTRKEHITVLLRFFFLNSFHEVERKAMRHDRPRASEAEIKNRSHLMFRPHVDLRYSPTASSWPMVCAAEEECKQVSSRL